MGQFDEAACIFDGGGGVMEGAWPNNDEETVVMLGNDLN